MVIAAEGRTHDLVFWGSEQVETVRQDAESLLRGMRLPSTLSLFLERRALDPNCAALDW